MDNQETVKKKGKLGKVIGGFFVLLILLIGGFIALLKFDVFGLGTEIIGPKIVDIPFATYILPEMPEEEVTVEGEGEESTTTADSVETLEEAIEIIKVTENLLKEKELEAEKLNEQITQLESENARLKVFEDNYDQFEADKQAFDEFIASNADQTAFITWFETMYPDNAASIYENAIVEQAMTEDLQDLIDTYDEMKPAAAAAILEEMATTRLEMVATIIKNLEEDQEGKVLAAMDTVVAARITAYLYPTE